MSQRCGRKRPDEGESEFAPTYLTGDKIKRREKKTTRYADNLRNHWRWNNSSGTQGDLGANRQVEEKIHISLVRVVTRVIFKEKHPGC